MRTTSRLPLARIWRALSMALLIVFLREAAAEPEFCLTGNSKGSSLNKRLSEAAYRYVWAGTNQPSFPAERYTSGWVSFVEGLLCDGQNLDLPFQGQLRDKCKYTTYAWPKKGYELEIDLGQVCEVTGFSLVGAKRITLKGYSPDARRWLPLAEGTTELRIDQFRSRRFRVEVEGAFAEMHVWGRTLGADSEEALPKAMAPVDPKEPFKGLSLKPSEEPALAPDPFVFPTPQEMSFGDELLELPKGCPLVFSPDAKPTVRELGETLAGHAAGLVNLDLKPSESANGPCVWMGLASDPGLFAEAGQRHKLGADQIPAEGHAVEITKERVVLVGRDERGLYCATRTFLSLLRARKEGAAVPVGHVRDFPRSEIRPAFAFQGWSGSFKRRLAIALATLKYSYLQGGDPQRELMRRNYLNYFISGELFPASKSGTAGDLLEAKPGVRAKSLNLARLSGCCSHPDFWKNMAAAWERAIEGWEGQIVTVGYDEIFHNPYNVCARCRSRGISTREMLLDAYLKAYRYLKKRGFGIMAYSTGFRRPSPKYKGFDMFVDIPTDSIITNYASRTSEHAELAGLGYRVIGGSTGPVRIEAGSHLHSGIVWNWGSEHPAAMFGEGKIRSQIIIAEQNWTPAEKRPEWKSPRWQARLNRAMDFVKHIVNVVPLPVPGFEPEYFTVDLSSKTNSALIDETYADGRGWLDQGPTRDLRHLPRGHQVLGGVPYEIVEGEKASIIVQGLGAADRLYPDQVTGIPLNRKAGELYFLHTCAKEIWTSLGRRVMLLGFYRIRYDDGTFVTAEINYGQHLGEWLREFGYRQMAVIPTEEPIPEAKVAWRGGTDGGHDVTLYTMPWRNPYPEKTIQAVDVLASAQMESCENRLCLLAVSGREPTELDSRSTSRLEDRPVPRKYRPRPPLPDGVAPLDLTRRTPPPIPVPITYVREWQTNDRWFTAKISALDGVSVPLGYEKSETNRGPYSALDPDDDPWRVARLELSNPSKLSISFKRLIELRGIGVKGIMQIIRHPGVFPVGFEVYVMDAEEEWTKVGETEGHVGQEGEERWVFDEPVMASGVEVRLTQGPGISAVYLYAKEGAVSPARFKPPKMDKSELSIGEEAEKKEDVSDEDVVDEFEGL